MRTSARPSRTLFLSQTVTRPPSTPESDSSSEACHRRADVTQWVPHRAQRAACSTLATRLDPRALFVSARRIASTALARGR